MKKRSVRVLSGLGLSLLLFACGQTPTPAGGDPYAGPDHPWSYTAPSGQLGALSLTPGLNTLYSEPILAAANGWGPIEIDHSNGEWHAGDGKTITLSGVKYQKGFGVHAPSELRYSLRGTDGARCNRFTVDVGVDDEVGGRGSVVFQVLLDGVKAYDSGTLTGSSATKMLNVNISGKQELRLLVTDAGNGKSYDHADWANPRIYCEAGTPAGPSGNFDASFKQVKPDFTVGDSAVQSDGKIVVFGQNEWGFVFVRYNADGEKDGSFGTNGETVVPGGSSNTAGQIVTQADGKIVAAGLSRFPRPVNGQQMHVALLRLLPNGRPDPTFGADGQVLAGAALRDFANFAVQKDGKIVVVEGADDFGVVRFKADGSLDGSFGKGGRVTTVSTYSTAQAVTVQGDGKIVAGGATFGGLPATKKPGTGRNLFARYKPDGSPDAGFGSGGQALMDAGRFVGQLDALAMQADGRTLYAGAQNFVPGCPVGRLGANGSPDTTFAPNKPDATPLPPSSILSGEHLKLLLQGDAKILVSGCARRSFGPGNATPVLLRLLPSGAQDASFGVSGSVEVQDGRNVGLQPGGKILVGLNLIARLFP